MRNERIYLADILAAIESIGSFVEGMSLDEFLADDKTASAVVRKLEVIGEAAKQVPAAIRQQYPEVPWKEMAGMRDVLIHFYFGVNLRLVWKTVQEDLPTTQKHIARILEELN